MKQLEKEIGVKKIDVLHHHLSFSLSRTRYTLRHLHASSFFLLLPLPFFYFAEQHRSLACYSIADNWGLIRWIHGAPSREMIIIHDNKSKNKIYYTNFPLFNVE
jgi:hypothetical protein